MTRRKKVPTVTSLVLAVLRSGGDFYNAKMLRRETGANGNQVSAALHDLRKYRAADVVIETDGTGWWFALPPEADLRTRIHIERTPEARPRKPRKPKVTPPAK